MSRLAQSLSETYKVDQTPIVDSDFKIIELNPNPPKKRGRPKKIVSEGITEESKKEYKCEWCKHKFTSEDRVILHMCEKKRRWMWRDEKYMKMAYMAFERVYELSYKKKPTYDKFITSTLYTKFVAFGRYVLSINAIDVMSFVNFLIKANIPLKEWVSPPNYKFWIREMTNNESIEAAVERSILLMEQWAREENDDWFNFFRNIKPAKVTYWIQIGRISPWVLYGTDSGKDLFNRLTDEQILILQDYIDPVFWEKKIKNEKSFDKVMKILCEAGV